MPKFRKKPVEIEAVLWTGENVAELIDFGATGGPSFEFAVGYKPSPVYIATLEGRMRADPGDWIIRGVQGEYYPCKPDIFEKTYEAV